jgi:hypothetical protein
MSAPQGRSVPPGSCEPPERTGDRWLAESGKSGWEWAHGADQGLQAACLSVFMIVGRA